jgi:hypothetical protein
LLQNGCERWVKSCAGGGLNARSSNLLHAWTESRSSDRGINRWSKNIQAYAAAAATARTRTHSNALPISASFPQPASSTLLRNGSQENHHRASNRRHTSWALLVFRAADRCATRRRGAPQLLRRTRSGIGTRWSCGVDPNSQMLGCFSRPGRQTFELSLALIIAP